MTPLEGIRPYLSLRTSDIKLLSLNSREFKNLELKEGDVVVYVSEERSSEAFDKKDVLLAADQWTDILQTRQHIDAFEDVDVRLVLVLSTRCVPSSLPDPSVADSILACISLGMEFGNALASILFGRSPSGCLPTTMFQRLEDSGAHRDISTYPGIEGEAPAPDGRPLDTQTVATLEVRRAKTGLLRTIYREGIQVGYRYVIANGITPQFPFGHGLTYTTFAFGAAEASVEEDAVVVRGSVANTGHFRAYCVVQVYFEPDLSGLDCELPDGYPRKLVGFTKLKLKVGAEAEYRVLVPRSELGFWSEEEHGWLPIPGKHKLLVGLSSANIQKELELEL